MAHLLGVTPAPNDGSFDSVRTLLRGQPERGVSADRIRRHLVTLASDAFEGRKPGTRGDTLATTYVREAMQASGLTPGADGERWFQSVPLISVTPRGTVRRWQDAVTRSVFGVDELVMRTQGPDGARQVAEAEVVFVGHGLVTADGKWDDYKGVDVRGKVVVHLYGPPTSEAWKASGAQWEQGLAERIAEARGAVAVVTMAGPALWIATRNGYTTERVWLAADTVRRTGLRLLLQRDAVTRFFGDATTMTTAGAEAEVATFRPRTLLGKIAIDYAPARRTFVSSNVLGLLHGSDPTLRDEVVVVTAHWDHLGRNPDLQRDQIYNGAFDNALGTGSMLEMARVLAAGPRPKRSVLFVATTAEESGLLGATWYTREPRFPLARTVAAINLDAGNPWGRTRDVIVLGGALSSLDSIFVAVAASQGRRVTPDPYPEQGFYRRSDHYAFARVGVPAIFTAAGMDVVGRPAGWGKTQFDAYLGGIYHSTRDEIAGDWDLQGGAEDVEAMLETVRRVANATERPRWNTMPETAPYRAAQAAQVKQP
jgi:Zn-dependent M28 family amino/carboxypeptidase